MSEDKETRNFYELILKYFLPMPVVENENVKNKVRDQLTSLMVDSGLKQLGVEATKNQELVSVGSRLDGLSVPEHVVISAAGAPGKPAYEASDMDEMTAVENLHVSKSGKAKCKIFDVEPTGNPLYVRLRLTREFVNLAQEEGLKLSRTDYLRTRAATLTSVETVNSTRKVTFPDSQNKNAIATEIHGPAATSVAIIEPAAAYRAELSRDSVTAFRHDRFPAERWRHRNRKSGWPGKDLIEQCVSAGGFIAPVGPGGVQGLDWRYSFTAQERILSKSLSLLQRKVYVLLKLIQRHCILDEFPSTALSSYHLKNVFFWLCEKIPLSFWIEQNIYNILITFLDELLGCLARGYLPHYFVPEGNLFVRVPRAHLRQLALAVKKSKSNMFQVLVTLASRVKFVDLYSTRSPMFLFIQFLQKRQESTSFSQLLVSTLEALANDYCNLIKFFLAKIEDCQPYQRDAHKTQHGDESDADSPTGDEAGAKSQDVSQNATQAETDASHEALYHIAMNNLTECLHLAFCDVEKLRTNSTSGRTREFLLSVTLKFMAKFCVEPMVTLWNFAYINFKTESEMDTASTLDASLESYEKINPAALTNEEYTSWKRSLLVAVDRDIPMRLPNAEWHKKMILSSDPELMKRILIDTVKVFKGDVISK